MNVNLQHSIKQANHKVLHFDINLALNEKGAVLGVFGQSGVGKSTILKILAGLIPSARCTIKLAGEIFTNTQGDKNPGVYIGADSPLFEHIDVAENLRVVSRYSSSRTPKGFSVANVIELCGLVKLVDQFPWQLSSGEKQRVCFARGLLTGKKLLLLDEAFSALDWTTRQQMYVVLSKLISENAYIAIMVSHSLKELSLCASQVIFIEQGAVVKQLPIELALEYQLEKSGNDLLSKNKIVETTHLNDASDVEDYFSAITAQFSHVDEQDSALHVWILSSKNAHLEANSELTAQAPSNYANKAFRLYVKAPVNTSQSVDSVKLELGRVYSSTSAKYTRTFIIDANQISVSRSENTQTSMLNCFEVIISKVSHTRNGVLLSAKWHQQTLRAMITLKSFTSLDIKHNDRLYFLCKAL